MHAAIICYADNDKCIKKNYTSLKGDRVSHIVVYKVKQFNFKLYVRKPLQSTKFPFYNEQTTTAVKKKSEY